MKWTVKLIAESNPGHSVEQEIVTLEREDLLSPATVGLMIAEGKVILEGLQKQMVAVQVQHHNASLNSCFRCDKTFRKGYYQSTLRSVYGNVPMRVRRIRGCSCTETQNRSYSTIPTSQNPITPELKYLTAKLAALLPFGEVTDFFRTPAVVSPNDGQYRAQPHPASRLPHDGDLPHCAGPADAVYFYFH